MAGNDEDINPDSLTIQIKAEIAVSLAQYMDYLIERGYYTSREDVVRQAILDLFIDKFEVSLMDLEPDLFEYPSLDDIEEGNDE
ncbi:MAG: hypothetical protein ACW964_12460 [Candidatus Hodarchaeales archaeon]|jgi:hypothetical protein